MRMPRFVLVMALVITLLGTFPGVTFAQDNPPPADQPAGSPLDVLWHSPTDRLGQSMRIDADFKFRIDDYKHLQDLSGRQRHFARGVFGAEGAIDFLLNKDNVNGPGHDNEFRLGVLGDYSYASDSDGGAGRSYQGIDLLDTYRTGGLVYAYLGSSPASKDWSYMVRLGTGAEYLHWGAVYGTFWRSQLVADAGYHVGNVGSFAIGPVAGVMGDLMIGEHQSNLMVMELTGGLRAVSENLTVDLRLLTQMGMEDANRLTGGPGMQKVQQEYVRMGVRVGLLAYGRVSLEFSWTSALLERFEVYHGSQSFSDTTPANTFALSAGFRF